MFFCCGSAREENPAPRTSNSAAVVSTKKDARGRGSDASRRGSQLRATSGPPERTPEMGAAGRRAKSHDAPRSAELDELQVGFVVEVIHAFTTSSSPPVQLSEGRSGRVTKVDDNERRALIAFNGIPRAQWVSKDDVRCLKINRNPRIRQKSEETLLQVGVYVVVTKDLETDSAKPVRIKADTIGCVKEVTESGAQIEFEGVEGLQLLEPTKQSLLRIEHEKPVLQKRKPVAGFKIAVIPKRIART